MAKKRLGVWKRLWIVLTVLWLLIAPLVGFGYWTNEQMVGANARRDLCEFMKADSLQPSSTDCWAEFGTDTESIQAGNGARYREAFLAALIVAGLAWLLGVIAFYTVRWILAGRETPEPPPVEQEVAP